MEPRPNDLPSNREPCPQCGVINRPGIEFCGGCGRLLARADLLDRSGLFRRPFWVSALAVVHFAAGGLLLLIGGLSILTLARFSIAPVIVLVAVGLGVAHLFCGRSLWSLDPAGRVVAMALAVLWLIGFPVGTVLGILTLVAMSRSDTRLLLSGRQPEELEPAELTRLYTVQQSGASSSIAVMAVIVGLLLFAIPISGIVAAIAIPNLLNAINRGRGMRTVVNMQAIDAFLGDYRQRHGSYPQGIDDIDQLADALEADEFRIPTLDGWRNPFVVEIGADSYRITSWARDGAPGPDPPDNTFDTDIVMENGVVVQAPPMIDTSRLGGPIQYDDSDDG